MDSILGSGRVPGQRRLCTALLIGTNFDAPPQTIKKCDLGGFGLDGLGTGHLPSNGLSKLGKDRNLISTMLVKLCWELMRLDEA